jgi:uncharacterized protein (DUF1778 family)
MHPTVTCENNAKGSRLEARISGQQKRLFQRAAELQGSTLTDFVISTLQAAAVRVVQDYEVMTLTEKDREIFVSALLQPAVPNGRLKKAVSRYKKLMD